MAAVTGRVKLLYLCLSLLSFLFKCNANDIIGCGGFLKSHVSLDFSKIEIGLYTKEGSLKEKTECAPTNGYYFLPLYEKGEYVLKVHPPPGWSFEPSQVELAVDGTTDQCSSGQDINFSFNGFGITGKVITVGQTEGPGGVLVQLINEKGENRETVTTNGGDFHFTPVIPGKYTVKASHSKWKLEPSQAIVQVKEGNTALPVGSLAVKGYDVRGSVSMSGHPVAGLYVLLYSKEESPKYRVEGCTTALLQGVPDAPICYSVTDASGEFKFGLVPAGDYKLLALAKPPGQATLTFNVKPQSVEFSVRHSSQFIKGAFEVTGVTVTGSVVGGAGAGEGLRGVRVVVGAGAGAGAGAREGAAVTDAAGKYTLPGMKPGSYRISFQHEHCEFDDIQLSITPSGGVTLPEARVARWRVCGVVTPSDPRDVTLTAERGTLVRTVSISHEQQGKWCTYLPPGVYTARVEVSDQEQRDGLQFYPVSEKVSVRASAVEGVSFSQLYATVRGEVRLAPRCPAAARVPLYVTLAGSGGTLVRKQPVVDGKYEFTDVLPGTVELSVTEGSDEGDEGDEGDTLCWERSRVTVRVTAAEVTAPSFVHVGRAVHVRTDQPLELHYARAEGGAAGGEAGEGGEAGSVSLSAGESRACVAAEDEYVLEPRACHLFRPDRVRVDTRRVAAPKVNFVAIAHAAVIQVVSSEKVSDLMLKINSHDEGTKEVGPLTAEPNGSEWIYTHTLYMKPGEVSVVSGRGTSLVFTPSSPQQVAGAAHCQPAALRLLAASGVTLRGAVTPPVEGVRVTLTSATDSTKLSVTTGADGRYSFGPLDASHSYSIVAEKESYVLGPVLPNGDIHAHKLAEIVVELRDEATGSLLQGALVSVSGGSYRRNLVTDTSGTLRFASLAPAQYYVKPLMKEYRFTPAHHLVDVLEGNTHALTLTGTRVAWSCSGRVMSLGGGGGGGGEAGVGAGVGAGGAVGLAARPRDPARCRLEEALTEHDGSFRIRGLLPKCVYDIQLKESSSPELAGLKLAMGSPTVEIKENEDITGLRLIVTVPQRVTDGNVVVVAPLDLYRTLKLTLALADTSDAPLYSARLDATGYSARNNPGLMYVLPRLPADNNTYVLALESTLSKATHAYENRVLYFVSDGRFKAFDIEFVAKVKSSEQELRQTSLLVVPLLGVVAVAFLYREQLTQQVLRAATAAAAAAAASADHAKASANKSHRPDLLDKASIDQIVSSVNAAGKKTGKKKTPFSN